MLSRNSLRSLATGAASAAMVKGLNLHFKMPLQPNSFSQQFQAHMLKTGVNMAVQNILSSQSQMEE